MHLEDLTSLPLKSILKRVTHMSSNYLSDMTEQVAAHSVGQFLVRKTEDLMWSLEKTIEWSAPSEVKKPPENTAVPDKKDANGSQETEVVPEVQPSRPLPWIFFIPVLAMLRGTQFAYETASSILGKAPVTPDNVVHFLRNHRRGLRSLRIRGKRIMKTRVSTATVFSRMTSFANSLLTALGKILGFVGFTSKKESKRNLEVSKRSKISVEDDDQEHMLEKLNRLSREVDSIEDDPDYQPDSTVSSDASSSSSNDVSEDETEASTPATYVVDEETPRATRTSSFIADIIQEENEESEDESTSSEPATPSFTLGDKDADSLDTPRNSEHSGAKLYPDLCDSHDSAIKQHNISNIFNKGLTPQSSF